MRWIARASLFPIGASLASIGIASDAVTSSIYISATTAPPMVLAEIVVPPSPDTGKRTSKAGDLRERAKAYQEPTTSSTSSAPSSTIIVVPEEDEERGLLGPRQQSNHPSGASENRTKAKQYQLGKDAEKITAPPPEIKDPAQPQTNAAKAHDNRAKARGYFASDVKLVIDRIGSDGIPLIQCGKLADNVAGRIGDDYQPGSIVYVMRDNKPFKVRCE